MNYVSMENFKAACKRMSNELKETGVNLKHQAILDIVARSFGHKDYNTYVGCLKKNTLPNQLKEQKKTSITFQFSGGDNMIEKILKAWKIASHKARVGEAMSSKTDGYIAPEYKTSSGKDYVIIEYNGHSNNILTAFFDMNAIMYNIDKNMTKHIINITKTSENIYHEKIIDIMNLFNF